MYILFFFSLKSLSMSKFRELDVARQEIQQLKEDVSYCYHNNNIFITIIAASIITILFCKIALSKATTGANQRDVRFVIFIIICIHRFINKFN